MRVLVVEDQKKMASFLRKGLSEAGYAVDVAESASSAEALSAENPYDIVLLDVMLPDRNGFDVARGIRRDGYTGPILMLTALGETRDKVSGLDAGADDYLTKPFSFDELLARVRALLRRRGSEAVQSVLRYADVEMNLVSRKVFRGGKEITLTQKEFALLEYFLRHPERPLTRTEISEHVWDMRFDSDSNVIDVYVNMLRKKVHAAAPADAPAGDDKLIQTVIGTGYVLRKKG